MSSIPFDYWKSTCMALIYMGTSTRNFSTVSLLHGELGRLGFLKETKAIAVQTKQDKTVRGAATRMKKGYKKPLIKKYWNWFSQCVSFTASSEPQLQFLIFFPHNNFTKAQDLSGLLQRDGTPVMLILNCLSWWKELLHGCIVQMYHAASNNAFHLRILHSLKNKVVKTN